MKHMNEWAVVERSTRTQARFLVSCETKYFVKTRTMQRDVES